MNTVLRVGVLLLFALTAFGSAWYIAFRLRNTFGLQRRWLLRVLVTAALVGSFMSMGPATTSADAVAALYRLRLVRRTRWSPCQDAGGRAEHLVRHFAIQVSRGH